MQRWNDKIRPVELCELDKQAHKMIIAYVLGKFEEDNQDFNWLEVIDGGIFEFLQRIVVTDIKPQLFHKIRKDKAKYRQLNNWVFQQIKPIIEPLGNDFSKRFKDHFKNDKENINKRVLGAAHFYATGWEFDIIERANPNGFEMRETRETFQKIQEKYYDLKGIQHLAMYKNLRNFVDLCGQLRFQIRWANKLRLPRTAVLGHLLIVAILCYLFSREIEASPKRCFNNFYTGLFHDLPEVLTRDVIDPVKKSVPGLDRLIKKYEEKEMQEKIYKIVPKKWHKDIKMFTEDEFTSRITLKNKSIKKNSDLISQKFNEDKYDPRDGEIVLAADKLALFTEAYLALKNGIIHPDFEEVTKSMKKNYSRLTIAGINFGKIYSEFK